METHSRKVFPETIKTIRLKLRFFFPPKVYIFAMLLFPLSGLPTFCLCNKGTGSLLRARRLRWQKFLPTTFARITLLVLVVYGLGESFLHRHLARQRVTKNTAECFCCCLAPEPVVQPGVMFGQRDGHPLASGLTDGQCFSSITISPIYLSLSVSPSFFFLHLIAHQMCS